MEPDASDALISPEMAEALRQMPVTVQTLVLQEVANLQSQMPDSEAQDLMQRALRRALNKL